MKYIKKYENTFRDVFKNQNHKYYIDTMGCELNKNDSMKYSAILEEMGIKKVKNLKNADIIIFNTCSIRENAEKTLYGRLGAVKTIKNTNKDLVVCVLGCMSQQKHVIEKIKKSYRFVNIVMGTHGIDSFSENIYQAVTNNKKSIEYIEQDEKIVEDIPVLYESDTKASVSIIYGCNNFCSYCIVPYVRGKERSRKKEYILKEIKNLAKKGYKEIILLGQNVNSYGNDFVDEKYTFVDLLKDIEKIKEIEIIRFLSPHPKDFSIELIEQIANSKKISKQVHLPLQSGSNNILKLMNRKYTKEKYLDLVNIMESKIKNVSFSTDIIVGFPNETKEDLEETIDVIKKVKFDQIYMFCYSKRKGTLAESMNGQVEEIEKIKRLEEIKEIHKRIVFEKNQKMVDQTFEVLVEGKSKNNKTMYTGRTKDNKIIVFKANKDDVGKLKKIKIIENNLWYLTGSII